MSELQTQLFFELFESLPRQGPGTRASTLRAFELCAQLPSDARVLDLGCGTGGQTLHLAELTGGNILAVDAHSPSITQMRATVTERGLSHRIEARHGRFQELGVDPRSFDLVWSEGALYNMGIPAALPFCSGLLRSGGYLAFTDAVWRTPNPPAVVRELFADYPTMGRPEDIEALIEANEDLALVDRFLLPDEAWWDDFYGPMEARIEEMRAQHADHPAALAVLEELAMEPAMHRKHAEHYTYAFFVCQRR